MINVAIQRDDYKVASAPFWAEALEANGFGVHWVDVRRPDILEQIKGCQGFMWRWGQFGGMGRIARRLLPVIEHELGMDVYPDQNSCWHYDDKIAQTYLFKALDIPAPATYIWFDRWAAREWGKEAPLPLVMKFAGGSASQNVRLIQSRTELLEWIDRAFIFRLTELRDWEQVRLNPFGRIRKVAGILKRGVVPDLFDNGYDQQTGYIYLQEFLPGNLYETRVTVIGKRVFAYKLFNRENDFRTGGSELRDLDPEHVDQRFVRLGLKVARALKMQSCGMDGFYRDGECVVSEVSYTYPSWIIPTLPGYWVLDGDPEDGELTWVPGRMQPEQAQIEDFMERLQKRWG